MANGTIISDLKKRVIDAITHDDTIFYTFGASDCENGGDLKDTHIFTYNKIPETITITDMYMTVMVHTKSRDRNKTYVTPTLEIWIYCHHGHMGELKCILNQEGTYNKDFLYRHLIFETVDINSSMCER